MTRYISMPQILDLAVSFFVVVVKSAVKQHPHSSLLRYFSHVGEKLVQIKHPVCKNCEHYLYGVIINM